MLDSVERLEMSACVRSRSPLIISSSGLLLLCMFVQQKHWRKKTHQQRRQLQQHAIANCKILSRIE